MSPVRRFLPEDIGVELFPAITSGLYKNPLDALREYVQNSIDAEARRVVIGLHRDVVSVRDDGVGMTREHAQRAIRLGISDKNPVDNIGFRGIGIYSSFELCDMLEIRTKSRADGVSSRIVVDFQAIRDMLGDEEARRKRRDEPKLHLQLMLSQAVAVEDDPDSPLEDAGTLVMMAGVRGAVARRLSDLGEVITYLQNVVQLPFDPAFRFANTITEKFKSEDYRTVDVYLEVSGNLVPVYRPYKNDTFAHGGEFTPKFFPLVSPNTKQKYGFAWVCMNDARQVLSDTKLRGLLIKKYGFSVADRQYLEPFFGRPVFARRMTGEVIVQSDELIPNAARTDFENSDARQDFQVALTDLVSKIGAWGDEVQLRLKALEELDEIAPRVFAISKLLPEARRDIDRLLTLNIELAGFVRTLKTHQRVLAREKPDLYEKTIKVLDEAQATIKGILTRSKEQPRAIADRAVRTARDAPTEEETEHRGDRPRTLADVLEWSGVVLTDRVRSAVDYIERVMLIPNLGEQYAEDLQALREYLEEKP